MKPLKRLKQTELMCCNYAPLLRLLWHYTQALVSATSAGSRRPFFFQDQWACPCRVLGGRRSMSRAFGLTPTTPLLSRRPSSVSALRSTHCQGRWISMHERKRTIFVKHKPNVNGRGHRVHRADTACSGAALKGAF